VAANILVSNVTGDVTGGISGGNVSGFREFAVVYSDFTPSFVADPNALKVAFNEIKNTNKLNIDPYRNDLRVFNPALRQKPYNAPFNPDEYAADQGTTTLNYRIEPFQARVNISSPNAMMREPAYVFSSKDME